MGSDGGDFGDVFSSGKTSLTSKEIQEYLAHMKAYYLKNGMPRLVVLNLRHFKCNAFFND